MGLIQHKQASIASGASSVSLLFTNPTNLNNRSIVSSVMFPSSSAQAPSSATDNGSPSSNIYNHDVTFNDNATSGIAQNDVFSANIVQNPASGNLQVSLSLNALQSGGNIEIQEVSGISTAQNAVDTTGTNTVANPGGTSATVSSTAAATATGEYGYWSFESGATNPNPLNGGTNTTVDDSDPTNGGYEGHLTNGATAGAVATVSLDWSGQSATGYMIVLVVYLNAASGVFYQQPFPRISGLKTPQLPFTPVIGLQATFLQPQQLPIIPVTVAVPQPIFVLSAQKKALKPRVGSAKVAGAAAPAATPLVLSSPQKPRLRLRQGSANVASSGPANPAPTTLRSPLKPRLVLRRGAEQIAGPAAQAATPLILKSPLKPALRIRRGQFQVAAIPQPPGAPTVLSSRQKARLLLRRGSGLSLTPSIPTPPAGITAKQKLPLTLRRSRFQKAAIFVPPPIIPPITMPRQASQYLRVRRALPVVNPQLAIPGFIGIGPTPPPQAGFFWQWTPKSTDLR